MTRPKVTTPHTQARPRYVCRGRVEGARGGGVPAGCTPLPPPPSPLHSAAAAKQFKSNEEGEELTSSTMGVNMPKEDTKVEARMIWKVLLFSEEKSKKGGCSVISLFLSLIFLFCDLM